MSDLGLILLCKKSLWEEEAKARVFMHTHAWMCNDDYDDLICVECLLYIYCRRNSWFLFQMKRCFYVIHISKWWNLRLISSTLIYLSTSHFPHISLIFVDLLYLWYIFHRYILIILILYFIRKYYVQFYSKSISAKSNSNFIHVPFLSSTTHFLDD